MSNLEQEEHNKKGMLAMAEFYRTLPPSESPFDKTKVNLLQDTRYCVQGMQHINGAGYTMSYEATRYLYHHLVSVLLRHSKLYKDGKPLITDAAYDELYKFAKSIEAHMPHITVPESPTQTPSNY